MMQIQGENIIIAKSVFEHFNKHEWEKMAALYSDPADFKDPSFGQEIVKQSRKKTIEKYKEMGDIFPDLRDDVVQIYPSGGKHVVVEFISSGTAPDGTKWTLPICTIFTIENGQIIKDFTYYDRK
ncbi:MAG: nuclear transport factor 2 family protein [Chloroflexi bacterium]|nr:nuclear transport factor 2 family protein [Chloroflexota bacterium]